MNMENLEIYHDGFIKLVNEGIVTQETFDMRHFRMGFDPLFNGEAGAVPYKHQNDCGTIGCALGWAPFIIKPKSEHYFDRGAKSMILDFDLYAHDVFDLNARQMYFLFSDIWVRYDNTIEGFIGRLETLIDGDYESLNSGY